MTLNVLNIVLGTIVDGPGIRTSVYLAGCVHHCPGCHNPSSWDPDGGVEMSIESIVSICVREGWPVTLTGGDPFYNPLKTLLLCKALKENGIKDILIYSGYTLEQIENDQNMSAALECADGLVDGPFVQSLRDTSLRFRGSSNQRIWLKENGVWVDAASRF